MSKDVYMNTPSGDQVQLATMEALNDMQTNISSAAPLGGKLVCTAVLSMDNTNNILSLGVSVDYLVLHVIQHAVMASNIPDVAFYGSNNSSYYSSIEASSTIQQKHTDDVIISKGCSSYILSSTVNNAASYLKLYTRYSSSYDDFDVNNWNTTMHSINPGKVSFSSDGTTLKVDNVANATYLNVEAYSFT